MEREKKAWKEIKELETDGNISEDSKFKAQEDLNKLTNDYNKKVEDLGEVKEKEIMTI